MYTAKCSLFAAASSAGDDESAAVPGPPRSAMQWGHHSSSVSDAAGPACHEPPQGQQDSWQSASNSSAHEWRGSGGEGMLTIDCIRTKSQRLVQMQNRQRLHLSISAKINALPTFSAIMVYNIKPCA